ncbi:nitrogenase component 1 [Lysinibacillus sp. NPDC097231]|uniref:nitrogenase component 1 n=1 Tax=Lysinibacillus sp. NPDC097231 TaxID=3364142 RepID=UPI00380E697D
MSRISSAFLPTNQYLGAIWSLAGIRDLYVINHGPAGCNFFEFAAGDKKTKARLYNRFGTTTVEQEDIALSGGEEKLKKSLQEIAALEECAVIAVISNPVSSLIGVDIDAVVTEMGEAIQKPILAFDNMSWKEGAEAGIEKTLYTLLERFCPATKEAIIPKKKNINIIGPVINTFKWGANEKELRRIFQLLGYDINVVFPYEATTKKIAEMSCASLNIVTRASGLKSAQYLREHFDIPFIYGLPWGQKHSLQWIEEVSKILNIKVPREFFENEEMISMHHYMEQVTAGAYYQNDWRTVIACPSEMAVGFVQLVREEWNLPVVAIRLTTIPMLDEIEKLREFGVDDIYVLPSEFEWKAVLNKTNPLILFGSIEETTLMKSSPIHMRINEPAYDTFDFFDGSPIIGFKGFQALTEQLLNQISMYSILKS